MSTRLITLAAGVPYRLPGGDFFQILDADYLVDVKLRRAGSVIAEADSVPVSWSYRPMPSQIDASVPAFDEVIITSATGQVVQVDISRGISGTNAVSGNVSVRESFRAAGQSDFAVHGLTNAVVGEIGYHQLFNPLGSGELWIVDAITASASDLSTFYLSTSNVLAAAATRVGRNKYAGAPDGPAVLTELSTASAVSRTTVGNWLGLAYTSVEMRAPNESQWIIPPGQSLMIHSQANRALVSSWRYSVRAVL